MRRRDLLAGLLLASAGQRRVSAQARPPSKVYRIAVAHPSHPVTDLSETGGLAYFRELFKELRRRGYVEGENLVVERHSGAGQAPPFAKMVEAVVRSNPDLIFLTMASLARAFKARTTTIPIVGVVADPVAYGLADSLARPGGNFTGASSDAGMEVWGKRLALLREAIPAVSRIGYLYEVIGATDVTANVVRDAARQAGISVVAAPASNPIGEAEYRRILAAMQQQNAEAVVVNDGGANMTHRRLIVELVSANRLPAIYPYREYIELGGLMAYAVDLVGVFRQAAVQIDKILKGAKPGEIPFYQATTFELIINLKTANALGIEMPPLLLARADEVIE